MGIIQLHSSSPKLRVAATPEWSSYIVNETLPGAGVDIKNYTNNAGFTADKSFLLLSASRHFLSLTEKLLLLLNPFFGIPQHWWLGFASPRLWPSLNLSFLLVFPQRSHFNVALWQRRRSRQPSQGRERQSTMIDTLNAIFLCRSDNTNPLKRTSICWSTYQLIYYEGPQALRIEVRWWSGE